MLAGDSEMTEFWSIVVFCVTLSRATIEEHLPVPKPRSPGICRHVGRLVLVHIFHFSTFRFVLKIFRYSIASPKFEISLSKACVLHNKCYLVYRTNTNQTTAARRTAWTTVMRDVGVRRPFFKARTAFLAVPTPYWLSFGMVSWSWSPLNCEL